MALSIAGKARVHTDPVASPTGFPFKVLQMDGTHSDNASYARRTRICDLGYLRHGYKKPDGTLGWRCPSEPVEDFLRKGGDEASTQGRKCVCNGLMANLGMGQTLATGELEKALITSGDDVADIARFLTPGSPTYSAADVIAYMLRDGAETIAAAAESRAAT